jgi:DnaJ-class molecular chaperone
MSEESIVYSKCQVCGGDGAISENRVDPVTKVETWVTVVCSKCAGTGYVAWGNLSDDLIDLLNDIKDKCNDIFEKVSE